MSNNKFKLSLIICIHNTKAEYFDECLTSIKNSTVKSVEVIVVDDGSDIDYGKILRSHGNIKYIKTENNGTLAARITGAKNASAPFVCYIDADDTVSFDFYEGLLARQSQTDADMVIGDWSFNTTSTKYVCTKDSTISKNFILKDFLILRRYFLSRGKEQSYFVLWNKLINKNLLLKSLSEIEKLNIDKMVFAEDVLITYFLFKNSKCVANVHLGYYFYRQHEENECKENSPTKLEDHIRASAKVFEIIENDLRLSDNLVYFEECLAAWKNMNFKSYSAKIKQNKFDLLLPVLKEEYGLQKVSAFVSADSKIYAHHKLLPDNLAEIDEELQKVYYSNKYVKVYAKKGGYAFLTLLTFKRMLSKRLDFVKKKKNANFVVSKEKYSFKNRFLHNYLIYRLGMMLFPKGSKTRNKLKSKI